MGVNPYNNTRWRRRRALQLSHEPLCRMCLEMGRYTEATVADHVEPHNGDMVKFWSGELQSLCATHHSSTKQRYEKTGVVSGSDVSGAPLNPRHHWNAH